MAGAIKIGMTCGRNGFDRPPRRSSGHDVVLAELRARGWLLPAQYFPPPPSGQFQNLVLDSP